MFWGELIFEEVAGGVGELIFEKVAGGVFWRVFRRVWRVFDGFWSFFTMIRMAGFHHNQRCH